jgi:hypothetical protein
MSSKVIAAIIRKAGGAPGEARYIVVRAAALGDDKILVVSQQDYERLQPGMLVNMTKGNWGPISKWRLTR